MLRNNLLTSSFFSVLYDNGLIEHYDSIRENNEPINKFNEVVKFLEKSKNIDCIFFKPTHHYHGPNILVNNGLQVNNIIISTSNELSTYIIDETYFSNSKNNILLYMNHLNTDFMTYDYQAYSDIIKSKILLGQSSFYGFNLNGQDKTLEINKFEPDKLNRLKNFNKILWAGRVHGLRRTIIDSIKKIGIDVVEIRPESARENWKFDSHKHKYIDVLIDNQCFAALSLDGSSINCYRDTEICFGCVPNLKYTNCNAPVDISADGSIYVSYGLNDILNQVIKIKEDLVNEDYSKILKARLWMENLLYMYRNRQIDISIFAFYQLKKINIKNLILHKEYNKSITNKDWSKIVNNIQLG